MKSKNNFIIINIYIFIFMILSSCQSNLQENKENSNENNISNNKNNDIAILKNGKIKTILLANVNIDENLKGKNGLNINKVEAGFQLAIDLTSNYSNIDYKIKDSIIKSSNKLTVKELSEKVNADFSAFMKIKKLENMIRVDLDLIDSKNEKLSGYGYSLIQFRLRENQQQIYDTAILKALQRALASILDSNLYAKAGGSFEVYPAPIIVIGGIEFLDKDESNEVEKNDNTNIINSNNSKKWKLYKNKEINSFDAVETIFETIYSKSKKFEVYDIASRDSMFAIFGIYGIDNNHFPTTNEILILNKMKVDNYIFGSLVKENNIVNLSLVLSQIKDNNLSVIKKVETKIENDDISNLREQIRKLTIEILE